MSILVCLKLILRSFELTMLVCSSPMFFACASSDVTKEYFKKFIVTFIEVASQTLFMSIALIIGIKQLTGVSIGNINGFGDLTQYFMSSTPYMIIMVAMCVMMIKPPKVLTNLLKGYSYREILIPAVLNGFQEQHGQHIRHALFCRQG